jgi:hypothetical protein
VLIFHRTVTLNCTVDIKKRQRNGNRRWERRTAQIRVDDKYTKQMKKMRKWRGAEDMKTSVLED